jgi:hypothetical protein
MASSSGPRCDVVRVLGVEAVIGEEVPAMVLDGLRELFPAEAHALIGAETVEVTLRPCLFRQCAYYICDQLAVVERRVIRFRQ